MTLRPLALLALLTLPLAGCGPELARSFGFTRDAPDEFQVTTRAPLSMPPSLAELPPPRPGAPRPQEVPVRVQAEALFNPAAARGGAGGAPLSPGEAALLAAAGQAAPRDIRERIDAEAVRLNAPARDLTERLMFWRDPPEPGTPVDPVREAQRLRENAALGRDVTEGETPIIQRQRPSGLFGGLRLF
ncbi:MAG: DUF3035 domain-containing protein [Rhodovarius sp.]|nr:DUF3035 domain-containing protein [Rhodovarius sp.]MCX7931920.1 DUF3035 domain-containing protein [Rhodovarius sp.]MDW8314447.1 DUF3035 domain-containing protein [Rhodovarius sp.]